MEMPITIPKKVTGGMDLVVLTKEAYDHLQHRLLEIEDALKKIKRGEEEYQQGLTRSTHSLAELDE